MLRLCMLLIFFSRLFSIVVFFSFSARSSYMYASSPGSGRDLVDMESCLCCMLSSIITSIYYRLLRYPNTPYYRTECHAAYLLEHNCDLSTLSEKLQIHELAATLTFGVTASEYSRLFRSIASGDSLTINSPFCSISSLK